MHAARTPRPWPITRLVEGAKAAREEDQRRAAPSPLAAITSPIAIWWSPPSPRNPPVTRDGSVLPVLRSTRIGCSTFRLLKPNAPAGIDRKHRFPCKATLIGTWTEPAGHSDTGITLRTHVHTYESAHRGAASADRLEGCMETAWKRTKAVRRSRRQWPSPRSGRLRHETQRGAVVRSRQAYFTRERSLVRNQPRPSSKCLLMRLLRGA
jgi:hypothetical protein